jgi:FAD binding domain-containing protein
MKALHARAARDGIGVLYETPAIGLLQGDRGVEGVRVRHQGRILDLRAKAVILAWAASRPMPRCGRAISGQTGTSPRCVARASTPAKG